MRRIENRGAIETAHRALQNRSQVFRYAIATGRAERDPAADLRGALRPERGEAPCLADGSEGSWGVAANNQRLPGLTDHKARPSACSAGLCSSRRVAEIRMGRI